MWFHDSGARMNIFTYYQKSRFEFYLQSTNIQNSKMRVVVTKFLKKSKLP